MHILYFIYLIDILLRLNDFPLRALSAIDVFVLFIKCQSDFAVKGTVVVQMSAYNVATVHARHGQTTAQEPYAAL